MLLFVSSPSAKGVYCFFMLVRAWLFAAPGCNSSGWLLYVFTIWSCVTDFSIICDVANISGYCRLGGSKFFNHKSVFVFSFSIMV